MAMTDDFAGPMWMSRSNTIVSMQQLEEECKRPQCPAQVLQAEPRPDSAVTDVVGAALPSYTFPAKECKVQPPQKRVRSFGDLHNALVPDMEELSMESGSDGLMLSSESGSDNEGIVPVHKAAAAAAAALSIPEETSAPVQLSHAKAPQGAMAAPLHMGLLDTILRTEWDDRRAQGLFRYDVSACPCKMVAGEYGFIAQLNEGRASKKRPTEFRIDQVAQAFDAGKFNFTKALQKEVLLQFEPSLEANPSFAASSTVKGSPNLVYINVSPIEYGHVLLVPRVMDCCPQVVDCGSLLLALNFLKQVNNAYFRIGFNSLGAYGTINHLHFQAYFLAAPFPIERASTRPVPGLRRSSGSVSISQLSGYAVRGLVFETTSSLSALASSVGQACRLLTDANVPHNLFIVDRGARVFLLPNAFAERKAKGLLPEEVLETQVDPASFELSGHLVLKRAPDFEAVTQDSCWRLLQCASLDEADFYEVVRTALPQEMRCAGRPSATFNGRLSGSFSRRCSSSSYSRASGSYLRT